MAEAFANRYGADVLQAASAGLTPAYANAPLTQKVMLEKNIDTSSHFPRGLNEIDVSRFDVVVNLSGFQIPGVKTINWNVADPYGSNIQSYRAARDQIESLVMQLILRIRMGKL